MRVGLTGPGARGAHEPCEALRPKLVATRPCQAPHDMALASPEPNGHVIPVGWVRCMHDGQKAPLTLLLSSGLRYWNLAWPQMRTNETGKGKRVCTALPSSSLGTPRFAGRSKRSLCVAVFTAVIRCFGWLSRDQRQPKRPRHHANVKWHSPLLSCPPFTVSFSRHSTRSTIHYSTQQVHYTSIATGR